MKEVTLSTGRKVSIESLSVAQTRELFFNTDGQLKNAEEQMHAAFVTLAASINNATYFHLPWHRKIFAKKSTPEQLENSLNMVEFRELQQKVVEISGLTRGSSEGEAQAAR